MAKPRPSRISERMPASAMPSEGRGNVAGDISASGVPSALKACTAASSSASSAALKWRIQSVCGCRSRPYQTPGPETGPGGMLGFPIRRRIPEWGNEAMDRVDFFAWHFQQCLRTVPIQTNQPGDSFRRRRRFGSLWPAARAVRLQVPRQCDLRAPEPRRGVGSIGTMQVRTAPPDGYTLLIARIATHAIFPALESKAPYKWNEFTMLSLLELNPYICAVRADSPVKTVQDLHAAIRRDPGKLNFSTAGPGTSQNMASQYLMSLAGLKPTDAVGIHYKSGGEVTTAVLGGQVHFACNNATTMVSQIRAGTLRGLFVTTPARLPEAPELQTAREAGVPDMEKIVGWTALMGPPGMPKDVVERWTAALASVAKDPEWLAGIAKIGGI